MTKYVKQRIYGDATIPNVGTADLRALKPARRSPLVALMRAQDRVITLGRRILLSQSLRGCAAWLVPDSNPDSASNTHPDNSTARITGRATVEITPGHMLRLSVLAVPAGQTQRFVGAGNYDPDGAGGSVRLTVNWTDALGATVTTVHETPLLPSPYQYGAQSAGGTGEAWGNLLVGEVTAIVPESYIATSNAAQWSLNTTAELVLSNIGGARIVDAVVSEEPNKIAYEVDTQGPIWASHVYGDTPGGVGPSITHPFQRLSEVGADGDRRGGTWHLMDVANGQAERLGPCLISATTYDEDDAGINVTETTSITTTSGTFVGWPDPNYTSYNADRPGWSFSCGGYSRPYKHNHPSAVGNDGVIPVRIRIYAGRGPSAGTTGVFRVQTAVDSYVDVSIPDIGSTAFAWRTAYGYLRCGQGPGDPVVAQAFFRRTAGAEVIAVKYLQVYKSGNFETN